MIRMKLNKIISKPALKFLPLKFGTRCFFYLAYSKHSKIKYLGQSLGMKSIRKLWAPKLYTIFKYYPSFQISACINGCHIEAGIVWWPNDLYLFIVSVFYSNKIYAILFHYFSGTILLHWATWYCKCMYKYLLFFKIYNLTIFWYSA